MNKPLISFIGAEDITIAKQRAAALQIGDWHFVIAAAKDVDPDDD